MELLLVLAMVGVGWWSIKANRGQSIFGHSKETKQIDTDAERANFSGSPSSFWDDLKDTATKSYTSKSTLHKAYGGVVLLFAIALVSQNYSYFLIMRLAVCVALYFFTVEAYRQRHAKGHWLAIILGLLILYNPIVPVHLGIHIVWTALNIATLFILYRARVALEMVEADPND